MIQYMIQFGDLMTDFLATSITVQYTVKQMLPVSCKCSAKSKLTQSSTKIITALNYLSLNVPASKT